MRIAHAGVGDEDPVSFSIQSGKLLRAQRVEALLGANPPEKLPQREAFGSRGKTGCAGVPAL